uniref:Uncharacterized protein n=1 Tax=Lepeophtheirus salmonis TaxID=72036 RepID=A0A0K2ULY8_LEPSM
MASHWLITKAKIMFGLNFMEFFKIIPSNNTFIGPYNDFVICKQIFNVFGHMRRIADCNYGCIFAWMRECCTYVFNNFNLKEGIILI